MEFFNWMDYVVIIVFILFAVVIVGIFVDQGPKKWLMVIGIIATGGMVLFFTYKKNKYTEAKLKKHNDRIKKLLDLVDQRDAVIEKNNHEITALSNERDALLQSANVDQEKIAELNQRIEKRLEAANTINEQIKAQEKILNEHVKKREADTPLERSADILAHYGLTGHRAATRPMVPDPSPYTADAEQISVKGFSMKGDV